MRDYNDLFDVRGCHENSLGSWEVSLHGNGTLNLGRNIHITVIH